MAKRGAGRRSAEQWAQDVAAWRRSGHTAREYASKRGLKASTLAWWAWKLGRSADSAAELELVPVRIVDDLEAEGSGSWELVTEDGHRVRGDGSLPVDVIRALVSSLVGR